MVLVLRLSDNMSPDFSSDPAIWHRSFLTPKDVLSSKVKWYHTEAQPLNRRCLGEVWLLLAQAQPFNRRRLARWVFWVLVGHRSCRDHGHGIGSQPTRFSLNISVLFDRKPRHEPAFAPCSRNLQILLCVDHPLRLFRPQNKGVQRNCVTIVLNRTRAPFSSH